MVYVQSFLKDLYTYISISCGTPIYINNYNVQSEIIDVDVEMGDYDKFMYRHSLPKNISDIIPYGAEIRTYLIDIKPGSTSGNITIYLENKTKYVIPIENNKVTGNVSVQHHDSPLSYNIKYSDDECLNLYERYHYDKLTHRYSLYNDNYNGIVEMWDHEGSKYEIIEHKKGIKDGIYELYINNQIVSYGYYIKGLKENTWRFNITKNSHEEVDYKKDRRDGMYRKYEDNNLSVEGSYVDDLMNGLWIYYNKDGTCEHIIYKDGMKNGIYKKYSNGRMSAYGYYSKDTKDNIWEYYDEDGKIANSYLYINGKLMEI